MEQEGFSEGSFSNSPEKSCPHAVLSAVVSKVEDGDALLF